MTPFARISIHVSLFSLVCSRGSHSEIEMNTSWRASPPYQGWVPAAAAGHVWGWYLYPGENFWFAPRDLLIGPYLLQNPCNLRNLRMIGNLCNLRTAFGSYRPSVEGNHGRCQGLD
jgi:hypothetical protein